VYDHAKRIFGPFMSRWGYQFPREWGDITPRALEKVEFAILTYLRKIYWGYIGECPNLFLGGAGKLLRKALLVIYSRGGNME
jgi:hypothetical protein